MLDRLGERQCRSLVPQRLDHPHERRDAAAGLAAHHAAARGLPQRRAGAAGVVLQLLQRARPDAARRKVDHAQQRTVVSGLGQQAQVGERVLHLGAFEEAHAAVDAVGQSGAEQRVLKHARLRVAAVEQRDLGQRHALVGEVLHDVDDERRLVEVGRGREDAHRLALALVGPQLLAEPRAVVADQRVGGVEDGAVRAIVLLELDEAHRLVGCREVALEVLHVRDVGAAEGVDRLVVVADGEHRGARPGEQPQPAVLQHVGVLELVDQKVREAAPVVLADRVVLREELEAAQQQLREVDHALALAHGLVEREVLDLRALEVVPRLDRVRPESRLLAVGDEVLELARRIALLVEAVGAVEALDQRELVGRVHDLEQLRQVRVAVVRPQHPVAQPVEGAHPHAARAHRCEHRQAREHLPRRLVGEGYGEDGERARLPRRDQPGDARGQHARLAASRPGEDQRRGVRERDGLVLPGIEVGEELGHGAGRGASAQELEERFYRAAVRVGRNATL